MQIVYKVSTAVFFTMVVGLIVFWVAITWWPFQAATFDPPTVITKTVQAGDLFVYNMNFTKHTAIRPKIQRVLISTEKSAPLVILESAIGVSRKGVNIRQIQVQIPKSVTPGKYKLMTFLQYPYFGGLRQVEYEVYTDEFTVTK